MSAGGGASGPRRSIGARLFFEVCRVLAWGVLTLVYRMRVFGATRVPAEGPLLVVANHQSHLDPPVIGVSVRPRQLSFVAREGLFRNPLFGRVISALNSLPIREQGADAAAIRRSVRWLEEGRALLIFPEGSRSPDGAVHEFKRGTWVLLSRARCPVLPVAVEGCFDAYPRHRTIPRLTGCRVAVMFGHPIPAEYLLALGPEAGLAHLRARIDAMRLDLRARLRLATKGRYPVHGPGDAPATG